MAVLKLLKGEDMLSALGDGNSQNLLKLLQEKSDDFSEVVIVPPGWRVAVNGSPISPVLEKIILVVAKVGGGVIAVTADVDIGLLLNDGILDRMRIPVRLARNQDEPLSPADLIPPSRAAS